MAWKPPEEHYCACGTRELLDLHAAGGGGAGAACGQRRRGIAGPHAYVREDPHGHAHHAERLCVGHRRRRQ
eukprot:11193195-Heterocapsa_arctica.AAC.1